MAKLTRFYHRIFGSTSTTTQMAAFGSYKNSAVQMTTDASTVASLPNWLVGMAEGVVNRNAPIIEELNGVLHHSSRQIAYLLQAGVAEYDPSTTYYTSSYCQNSGVLYKSLIDDNIGYPVTSATTWKKIVMLADGTSGGIPFYTDATTLSSSALLALNTMMLGGGAGLTPKTFAGTSGGIAAFGTNGTTISSALLTANQLIVGKGAGNAPASLAGTSGGIPYFNASGEVVSSAALTANALVLGGGAGATPVSLALGTKGQSAMVNEAETAVIHSHLPIQITFSSGSSQLTAGQTAYIGAAYLNTTEGFMAIRLPFNCWIDNMAGWCSAGAASGTVTCTLRKGYADTALTVTGAAGVNVWETADGVNAVSVNAYDYLTVKLVTSAGTSPNGIVNVSFRIRPRN